MMVANVHGQFETVDGTVDFNPDDPAQSSVDLRINAGSITTRDAQRDAHLRSADFFDADRYPYLNFKSKRVEVLDDEHARLVGNLTIRDVTREVVLDVEYNGTYKNPWGKMVAGFGGKAKINRKDWGLNWNVALETGGWLVSDTSAINIDLEIVQQPEVVAETIA
jgi:polyisoprenoid-binding protein YceI